MVANMAGLSRPSRLAISALTASRWVVVSMPGATQVSRAGKDAAGQRGHRDIHRFAHPHLGSVFLAHIADQPEPVEIADGEDRIGRTGLDELARSHQALGDGAGNRRRQFGRRREGAVLALGFHGVDLGIAKAQRMQLAARRDQRPPVAAA